MCGSTWRLAQVRPNSLHIAERNLLRQGFGIFCPTREETRRRGGRFITAQAPLFPGYLFVSVSPVASPLRAINSTFGVVRVVGFGRESAAEVPAALVAELMARCDTQGRLKAASSLQPGDAVKVMSGPFSQFVATVDSIDSQRRVWLLLELLGRPTRVAVSTDDLRLA